MTPGHQVERGTLPQREIDPAHRELDALGRTSFGAPFDGGWQHGAMPLDPAAILACGDVHGDAGEVAYCLTVAEEQAAQAVFFLGDFGYWEHEPSGVAYLDQVEKAASAHDLPVYFLDGNHDKISLLLETYQE